MKLIYLSLWILSIKTACFSQNDASIDTLSTKEILESVVLIKESDQLNRTGSGFLMEHNNQYYLVTAEHVKMMTNSESYIAIGKHGKDTKNILIRNLIENSLLAIWKTHPSADLSILKLSSKKGYLDNIKEHFIKSNNIVQSLPDSTINDKSGFYTVGFPLGYGIAPVFDPLTKHSNLSVNRIQNRSSWEIYGTNDVFKNKRLIHLLLEDPSIGGFSGGPVYFPGSAFGLRLIMGSVYPKVIGIVSGTIGDSTGGKMAVITPAHLIFELLE